MSLASGLWLGLLVVDVVVALTTVPPFALMAASTSLAVKEEGVRLHCKGSSSQTSCYVTHPF